jgi:hypothetical protein
MDDEDEEAIFAFCCRCGVDVAKGRPPGQASGSEEESTNLTSESRDVESSLVKLTRVGVPGVFNFLEAFFSQSLRKMFCS